MGNNKFKNRGWGDTFKQISPEVILSTLMSMGTGIGAEFASTRGRQNIQTEQQASQKLGEMGINTVQQGENYLDNLVKQLPQLVQEFTDLTVANADPNIDNSARFQELTNSISQAYDFLNNFSVFSPSSVREKLNGIDTPMIFDEKNLKAMKEQRDKIQDELNSLYQSMTGDMDTDIENILTCDFIQAGYEEFFHYWVCSWCKETLFFDRGSPKDNGYCYCPYCGRKIIKEIRNYE